MNPVARFNVDNFEEIVKEIGKTCHSEYLFVLEDAILNEIVELLKTFPPSEARAKLARIQEIIDLPASKFEPHVRPLLVSLKNSVKGGLFAARIWME